MTPYFCLGELNMRIGTIHSLKSLWPGLNGHRMMAIKLAMKKTALRSKLHSLNREYESRFHQLKHERQTENFLKAQETYWYETACLMEESRKLKLSCLNGSHAEIDPPVNGETISLFDNTSLFTQILNATLERPPTIIPIVVLSLLHGISLCAGFLWFLAPHLMNM